MRADRCLDAKTALSESTLRSSLSQDIIRRLTNMDLELPISEKIETLDKFYDKMRNSGHPHAFIRTIFMESLLKFNLMVKNSLLDPSNPKYRPLYLANDFDRENRGIKKFLRKFN